MGLRQAGKLAQRNEDVSISPERLLSACSWPLGPRGVLQDLQNLAFPVKRLYASQSLTRYSAQLASQRAER